MVKKKFIYENKNVEETILDLLREEILGMDKRKHKIIIRTRIGIIQIIPEMNRLVLWSKTDLEELMNKFKGLDMKEIKHAGPKGIKFKLLKMFLFFRQHLFLFLQFNKLNGKEKSNSICHKREVKIKVP